MEFIVLPPLPKGRAVYTGDDVVNIIATLKGISADEAYTIIENAETIIPSSFMTRSIIIGKSGGQLVALKFASLDRNAQCGKYFDSGMFVAIREPTSFDKSKASRRWKEVQKAIQINSAS